MPGVYEIYVKDYFSADHALKGDDGKTALPHGHKWAVEARIQCATLNKLGVGLEFGDVKNVVEDILGRLDYTCLNDVAELSSINPTAENLAKFIYTELGRRLNTKTVRVNKVKVFENPDCGVSYSEIQPG